MFGAMVRELAAPPTASVENPAVNLFDAILAATEGERMASGVRVSERGAMGALAVGTCVHVLSETFATLPFHVFSVGSDGRRRPEPDNPYRLAIAGAPNDEMDGFLFAETLVAHLLTWGNAYAYRDYNSAGEAYLWPITPDRCRVEVLETNQGTPEKVALMLIGGKMHSLPTDRLFHVAWLGFDGLRGYSPIRLASRNLGLSIAMERFAERFFGAGAYVSGFVTHPAKLSDPTKARLRESLEHLHSGLERSHRFALLDEGMDFKPLEMPLEDLQLLESRSFARAEIAGLYRLTPDRINVFEKAATYASLDAAEIRLVKDAVAPLAVRFEAAINRQLLGTWDEDQKQRSSGRRYYCRFNLDGVLRGDPKVRAEVQQIRRQMGVLNADEIRSLEEMDPLGGVVGETYLWPENQRPAELPYPESRGGPQRAVSTPEPPAAREVAAPSPATETQATSDLVLTEALFSALERTATREGHGLGRLPDLAAQTVATWYEQKFDVQALGRELVVAFRIFAASLGCQPGPETSQVIDPYARARAEAYREARVRGVAAGEDAPPLGGLVQLELTAARQTLKPRLLALRRFVP